MKPRAIAIVVLSVLAFGGPADRAQSAPAANPREVIPDKIPLNVRYGVPIPLDRAQAAIAAAAAEAKQHDRKMSVAVVASGGNLVAFARMDGALLAAVSIAEHKARTAAIFRRDTKLFENNVQKGPVYQLSLDGVIAARGGIALIEDGKLIGASGGAGSQDEVCPKAGVATSNK